ncbi:hypothetical protein VB773_16410 [Haloarculaceae archaeon H-GB2-1]|nr:hypothetical protein [Haloarculaceae archaeon H-GB1-1]MEA5387513.1 hypothetical protein [Haloarculaceae archaeon H-GB11]MEA5408995.1 hypothetical protein [Haloarculaceae archaeon H-GB2-1]
MTSSSSRLGTIRSATSQPEPSITVSVPDEAVEAAAQERGVPVADAAPASDTAAAYETLASRLLATEDRASESATDSRAGTTVEAAELSSEQT